MLTSMIDELFTGAPNCPVCLHRLEAAGPEDRPFWACTSRGYVAIALS